MSSTNTLTPSKLLEYHSTERLEKVVDDLIEHIQRLSVIPSNKSY